MISKPKKKVRKRKNPFSFMDDFVGKNIKLSFEFSKTKGYIEGKLHRKGKLYSIENQYSGITFVSSDLLNIGYDEDNVLIGTLWPSSD